MSKQQYDADGASRRQFLAGAAGALAATVAGAAATSIAQAQTPAAPAVGQARKGLNILFVFTDQERFHAKWPTGLSLPGHERLAASGVSFQNHYCPATMCTSSRSVLMTGLQTADNGMFENLDVPWMQDLSLKTPTIGHMLRKAGYYTAYKGKWHLSRAADTKVVDRYMTAEMEKYGFSDNFSPGDLIGHTLGGYSFDHITTGSAINWLRTKGRPLNDEGKPWAMTVSLVNPHDIMYFNTDAPGEKVQDNGRLMLHAARAPSHELYRATWDVPVAANLRQPFDAPGRPTAHGEFHKIWDYILGNIPAEEARWRRFNDYYINCIRNVDRQIQALTAELDALSLSDRTIIVFTADHGEAAGAHGLRGKGPFAYQETMHLPMVIAHPDVRGGQSTRAISSHMDIAPTLLAFAGASKAQVGEFAGRDLPGKDMAAVLGSPGSAATDAIREAALFTYSGLASNDSGVFDFALKAKLAGKDPKEEAKKQGFRPDLRKRGTVRAAFDGRYKFARYCAPVQRNSPTNLDDLYRWNDVELYDVQNDPAEMNNLAVDRAKNADLVMAMSAKLERVIKAEIGRDDGREMPDTGKIDWGLDKADL